MSDRTAKHWKWLLLLCAMASPLQAQTPTQSAGGAPASAAKADTGRVAPGVAPASSVRSAGPTAPSGQEAAAATDTAGFPVIVAGDTLFRIKARIGPFSARDRAAAIEHRLMSVAGPGGKTPKVQVAESEAGSDIMANDLILMTVTDADAAAAGQPRAELAVDYAMKVRQAIAERRQAFNIKAIIMGALYTLLATAALVLLLRLLSHVFPRLYALIRRWRGTRIPGLRIQRLELVSAERVADGLTLAARVARVALTILLLYFYLPLVFSFFPWTQNLASQLVSWVIGPIGDGAQAVANYLPNLFTIAVIVVVTRWLLRMIRLVFDGLAGGTITLRGFYPDWADTTYKIVRFMVLAFAVILCWPYLPKSNSEGFKGVAAFLGVLLSFGSATAVGNVIGGIVMVYMRPFEIGDRVRIADTVGDVVEKTLLITRVRTIKNVDVTVPNAMVLASHIINYSSTGKAGGLILHTSVTIGYDAPWRDVHETLKKAAAATQGLLSDPPPFVLQTALDDFYVAYQINAYTDRPNEMANIYSRLHENIQDQFNQAGIEINSPHYSALRDGNETTIPSGYRPAGYEAPPFRVLRALLQQRPRPARDSEGDGGSGPEPGATLTDGGSARPAEPARDVGE
jgi:small-conductance mechanosensitive channel